MLSPSLYIKAECHMYIPTTLKIIVLKGNKNQDGQVPILLKFTQSRKTNRISLRKWINPEDWIDDGATYVRERGRSAPANAKELNLFLKSQLSRAELMLLEAERQNVPISFQQFKEKFVNMASTDFIAFCEGELQRRSESGKYSDETIKSNWFKLNKLRAFRPNISFFDLTVKFLEAYETWLRTQRGNDVNTIFAAMKFVRTMLNCARRQNLTTVYPFKQYKLVYKKDTRDRLTEKELDLLRKLYDEGTLPDHSERVLKYFLFACYTGLSWGDLSSLDYSEIEKRGEVHVISKERGKTGQLFVVPLMAKAKKLIDMEQGKGKVFSDIISNQKANAAIKKIVASTRIKKHVTFHVARHTFGSVALNNGIPREAIQRMLGHSKEEMTKLYSKLQDETLIREMTKWEQSSPATDYVDRLSKETVSKYKKLRTMLVANRIAGGFSEADAAASIGVNVPDYKRMEMGEVQFGFAAVLELAGFLGVDVNSFF